MSFAGGDIIHGGDPLISGIRYILAVFLFLEKDDENENKIENIEMKSKTEIEDDEKEIEENIFEDEKIEGMGKKCGEEDESFLFIKSFLSCYKTDPYFLLKPTKNEESDSKMGTVIDDLIVKSTVYHTETEKSSFSFGFDFIE